MTLLAYALVGVAVSAVMAGYAAAQGSAWLAGLALGSGLICAAAALARAEGMRDRAYLEGRREVLDARLRVVREEE